MKTTSALVWTAAATAASFWILGGAASDAPRLTARANAIQALNEEPRATLVRPEMRTERGAARSVAEPDVAQGVEGVPPGRALATPVAGPTVPQLVGLEAVAGRLRSTLMLDPAAQDADRERWYAGQSLGSVARTLHDIQALQSLASANSKSAHGAVGTDSATLGAELVFLQQRVHAAVHLPETPHRTRYGTFDDGVLESIFPEPRDRFALAKLLSAEVNQGILDAGRDQLEEQRRDSSKRAFQGMML